MSSSIRRARVVERRALSPRVTELALALELEDDGAFRWRAGQHLTLRPDISDAEASAFSISVAPTQAGLRRLTLAVSNASELLGRAPVGARLVLEGPFGELTWHSAAGALLVGAGTGVAPLRAIVHAALSLDEPTPIVLIAGNRRTDDLLWHVELTALAEEHARFRYEPVLSRPERGFTGRRGHVQDHLLDLARGLPEAMRAYLCGSTQMVEDCRRLLAGAGVSPDRILSEADA